MLAGKKRGERKFSPCYLDVIRLTNIYFSIDKSIRKYYNVVTTKRKEVTNMTNPNRDNFKHISDKELTRRIIELQNELAQRAQERADRRKKWVYRMLQEYINHPFASSRVVDEVTVMAVYSRGKLSMAQSTPVRGDIYNKQVGIAVAFAKAMGYPIPDYI